MEENGDENKALRCPNCGWTDVRRSMPHGWLDYLVRMVGLVPYRCRSCGMRFYRPQRQISQEPIK
jgi:DNA-directed RNA polymerase subunit RPC12/RpoP